MNISTALMPCQIFKKYIKSNKVNDCIVACNVVSDVKAVQAQYKNEKTGLGVCVCVYFEIIYHCVSHRMLLNVRNVGKIVVAQCNVSQDKTATQVNRSLSKWF